MLINTHTPKHAGIMRIVFTPEQHLPTQMRYYRGVCEFLGAWWVVLGSGEKNVVRVLTIYHQSPTCVCVCVVCKANTHGKEMFFFCVRCECVRACVHACWHWVRGCGGRMKLRLSKIKVCVCVCSGAGCACCNVFAAMNYVRISVSVRLWRRRLMRVCCTTRHDTWPRPRFVHATIIIINELARIHSHYIRNEDIFVVVVVVVEVRPIFATATVQESSRVSSLPRKFHQYPIIAPLSWQSGRTSEALRVSVEAAAAYN